MPRKYTCLQHMLYFHYRERFCSRFFKCCMCDFKRMSSSEKKNQFTMHYPFVERMWLVPWANIYELYYMLKKKLSLIQFNWCISRSIFFHVHSDCNFLGFFLVLLCYISKCLLNLSNYRKKHTL